jgi:hypothetical protein
MDLGLEGDGGREEWPAGHVDGWLAVHLLQTDIAMSVETPLCPYISPLWLKTKQHSPPCSSPLVKVPD